MGGAKGKMTAKAEMERMQLTLDSTLLLMIFHGWKRESKLERMKRYGTEKNNQRKKQLQNVKGLFKNFAGEVKVSDLCSKPALLIARVCVDSLSLFSCVFEV